MNSSTKIVTLVKVKSTNSAHEGQHNSTIIIIINHSSTSGGSKLVIAVQTKKT